MPCKDLLLTVVALLLLPVAADSQAIFREDFDGPSLDTARWNVTAGDGALEFVGGRLRLSAPCGGQFPYVVARSNPFPESGDFRVKVGFRYVAVQQGGNGFSVTTSGCAGYSCNAGIAVWQDFCCGGFRCNVGTASIPLGPAPNTEDHVFEWESISGVYYFSLDGNPRASNPMASRPSGFWFGHPPYRYCPWTTQEIDFVEIAPLMPVPIHAQSWGRLKSLYR